MNCPRHNYDPILWIAMDRSVDSANQLLLWSLYLTFDDRGKERKALQYLSTSEMAPNPQLTVLILLFPGCDKPTRQNQAQAESEYGHRELWIAGKECQEKRTECYQ